MAASLVTAQWRSLLSERRDVSSSRLGSVLLAAIRADLSSAREALNRIAVWNRSLSYLGPGSSCGSIQG